MNKHSLLMAGALGACTILIAACGSDTATNASTTMTDSGAAADAAISDRTTSGGDTATSGGDTATSGGDTATSGGKIPPNTAPSADTKALWAKITGYAKWTEIESTKSMPQSKSHQNMFVHAYYNTVVADFMKTGKKAPLPEGSILVKANFKTKTATKPAALTVMEKLKNGKWYWLKAMGNGNVFLGPDGKTAAEGQVSSCIKCHTAMAPAGNDMVVSQVFGK